MAKVLVVDDSSLGRKLLIRILNKLGHEVVGEAESGEQAILQYRKAAPDIVAMDVDMPGIGGLEASGRILDYDPKAKIVIVSAHEKNDLMIEMDRYGLKHSIIKPVNEDNVSSAFQNVLKDNEAADSNHTGEDGGTDEGDRTGLPGSELMIGNDTPKEKFFLSHYNFTSICMGYKTGEAGNELFLKIETETPFNFNKEDPLVVGYEADGRQMLARCKISGTNAAAGLIRAEIVNTYPLEVGNVYQNLPASLLADLRVISTRKRYPAIIRTFMINELVFLAKADINMNEKVCFDLFQGNKVLPIEGSVISKIPGEKNSEYVIKLTFDDYNMKTQYTAYLKELAGSMEKSVRAAYITV